MCLLVFGIHFQQAHTQPNSCFPQGDQEYFFHPGTYYDYLDPGGEPLPGDACPPNLKPEPGVGYFKQLENQLACREELQMNSPSVTEEKLNEVCAYVPILRTDHPDSDQTNFFYIRRLSLLIIGLLAIAFLGTGASIRERFKALGFQVDGSIAGAIAFGLILGYFTPLQFTFAALGPLLAVTALHVLCEEVFFRGFVTRKLLDSFSTPLTPVMLSGMLFGLYHITYTSFWWGGPMALSSWVGLVTLAAGVPYAILYVRSSSMIPPLICHLVVNLFMMYRSNSALTDIMSI